MITQTLKKEINDILESVYEKDYVKISEGSNICGNLKKHLKALDKKMKEAASNLEFEEAAKIRDEIRKLESTELEITLNPKIKDNVATMAIDAKPLRRSRRMEATTRGFCALLLHKPNALRRSPPIAVGKKRFPKRP